SPGGTYSFTQAFTQGPNPLTSSGTAGDAFASMLLGTPASGSITTDVGVSMQSFYFAGYFQDEIKATDRLTISAGLRYETESPYTERHNRIVGFDSNLSSPAANAAFPNLRGGLVFASPSNRYVYDWYKKGFGPRLGLAYQAAKHTVFRAGAGVFYAPLQISNSAVGFSPSSGFSSSTPLTASIDGGLTPFNSLANAFSSGLIPPSGNSLGASTFLGQGITVWDSHPNTPRSYQWNFDIQHQLPWDVLIDAAYVGNKGVFLAGNRQFDAMPSQYLPIGSALLNQVPNPFYGKITTGTLAQPTVTLQSLLTPFPQFTSVDIINDTAGNSMYHAFQLKVEKRLSSGLSVLVSYSFEKIITDVPWAASGIGGNNGSGTFQNWYNLSAERALSAQDVPNSLTISYNYALPFGKGKSIGSQWHGPVEWILGNWALNGITRVTSGSPLSFSTSVNNTHSLGGGSRPNTNGVNAVVSNPNIYQWFNTATFTAPAAFTFGNVGRTTNVFSPGIVNFDASIFKNMIFHERYTLQFRAEFFNLFNHENFNPPDTTLGDKNFGQISASNLLPRVGQLAMKLTF
ncbi:MAG TPA: TonB-dependent receptor, partial [Bryobacteraceae bacterium]